MYDELVGQITQKEKSHVDYRRNLGNSVATRLFRSEYKSKFPENRQLDPYFARYCRHHHRSEPAGDHLDQRFTETGEDACLATTHIQHRKEISDVIHHYHNTDRTVHYWLLAIEPIH